MIFVESFEDGADDGLPHEFGPVFYFVFAAVVIDGIELTFVKQDGFAVDAFEGFFFLFLLPFHVTGVF